MDFDYQDWLEAQLGEIINNQYDFVVSEEQQFVNNKRKKANCLYIVWKQLAGPTSYHVKSVNCQILIVSEQNSLEYAKSVAKEFVDRTNFNVVEGENYIIKHSYQQPTVLSNFNEVDAGLRSIVFVSGNLQVMDGLDIFNIDNKLGVIKINRDGIEGYPVYVEYLNLTVNYSMTGDTQQLPTQEIALTKKSNASLSIAFSMVLTNDKFTEDLLHIQTGDLSGNTSFSVSFNRGSELFSKDMKVISIQTDDAPDQAPGLKVGMML